MAKMTSNRPYLVRAMFDWLVDNDCTPHIVVNAYYPEVSVPQQYISKGQIILNIAPRATTNFVMDNEAIAFSTRFGGVPTQLYIPTMAVMGIYARENGQGLMFEMDEVDGVSSTLDEDGDGQPEPPKPRNKGPNGSKPKPSLKVVK
jgi:stringent starvation protein B